MFRRSLRSSNATNGWKKRAEISNPGSQKRFLSIRVGEGKMIGPGKSCTVVMRLNISFQLEKGTYPSNTIMWSKQDKLPRLPIPSLEDTLTR